MRIINAITDWLLYTSMFAALCAVSLCMATEQLILNELPRLFTPLHCFIAGCTMMVYNGHFLIKKTPLHISDRMRWTYSHLIWHYIVFIVGAITCSVTLFYLSYKLLIACVALGILSFAYTLPLLPFKTQLRDYGWLKIITLTLVWTIVTSAIPIVHWEKSLNDFPFEILMRFMFMFVLCIAFDIRDMQTDTERSIKTLPNILGVKNSNLLINISLAVFLALCVIQYFRYPNMGRLVAEVALAFVARIAITYCNSHQSDKNYLGLVDGMMLLYGIVIMFLA